MTDEVPPRQAFAQPHVDRAAEALRRAAQYLEADDPPVERVREHVGTAREELDAHQEGQR